MAFLPILLPVAAHAHERFIRHFLKERLPEEFYQFFRQAPGGVLGMNPNMAAIGAVVAMVITGCLVFWFFRQPAEHFVQFRVFGRVRGEPQNLLHVLACFLTDRPVKHPLFRTVGEWAVILFLRSPALVLMYSATNDSLVMPSYPLDPSSALAFKYLQVVLALLILGQMLLPLCGAMIFGTWLFLFNWGASVAIDAMPVLTVAVVYVTSPWHSHRIAITELNATQARWVRLTLGLGFFALGWMKIVNHDLVAAVAQNYPGVMNDPMIGLFTLFTSAAGAPENLLANGNFRLATWIVAFGLAEVMSGFMLMAGVFTRVWCMFMIFVFTKLMLFDFGWDEIPHIYPIAALLAVMFSNRINDEFDRVEELEERYGREGRTARQVLTVLGVSLLVGFLVIFPLLYATTLVDRSFFGFRLSP